MDDISFLVDQTYKHFEKLPLDFKEEESPVDESFEGAGILYHIQKSPSVFAIRTFVSDQLNLDYQNILSSPEDYPSLRLLENFDSDVSSRLKIFPLESVAQAEVIHDLLHNRRFPVNEEMMCNLSDPGFSWWLTKKNNGFSISFKLSSEIGKETLKLGPLGDREFAQKNFILLSELVSEAGLEMNIQNETNRVQFADCEPFLLEELNDLFEYGVVTETLKDLFKILAKKLPHKANLESLWFFLEELAAVRRFWIQVQVNLDS